MEQAERIRWGAIDFEFCTCFDNLTIDEFMEENKRSPEVGFFDAYNWLISTSIKEIKDCYGEELFETFCYSEENAIETRDKVEKKLEETKNTVELQKTFLSKS